MIWVLGVLCALALVALFFPFIFWVDFDAGMKGLNVRVRLFKKELYTYHKKFGKDDEDDSELFDISTPETEPVEKSEAPKIEEPEPTPENTAEGINQTEADKPAVAETKAEDEKPEDDKSEKVESAEEKSADIKAEKVENKSDDKLEEVKPTEEKSDEGKAEEKDAPEKRSLTDQEFWTLLLTPEFDTRAWWAVRHELSALFKLFRIRFTDSFVEGIRMEYENMGYAAALNGFLKSYPYIGDWDFRMDWTYDHEPRAEGHLKASVNLCRTLGLLLATLFYGGILAFTFWRRRAHILKTGELPELGFVRKKIVNIMTEDD
ncbi:MAG: hypothetical protein IKO21_10980 [Fibrobacter sp.]|nr:hypothetical protein [Fibrobacter sp.]